MPFSLGVSMPPPVIGGAYRLALLYQSRCSPNFKHQSKPLAPSRIQRQSCRRKANRLGFDQGLPKRFLGTVMASTAVARQAGFVLQVLEITHTALHRALDIAFRNPMAETNNHDEPVWLTGSFYRKCELFVIAIKL